MYIKRQCFSKRGQLYPKERKNNKLTNGIKVLYSKNILPLNVIRRWKAF